MASQTNPFTVPYDPYDTYDTYDTYDMPDPMAMSNLSRESVDVSSSWNRPAESPEISPPVSPPVGFGASRGFGQNSLYAPVNGSQSTTTMAPESKNSLYSVNSLSTYKTQDEATQRLVDRRAGELAQWQIHWFTPAMAITLFVAGIMAAVGHHLFYASLDGRPAEDQLKMIRFGTALAFFVKSTLVGSIILCYRQRIWRTFRRKAMTMRAIDSLFTATEDPTSFLNWEMVSAGKLATFMALCSW